MSSVMQVATDGITLAETVRNLAHRSYAVVTRARAGVGSDPREIRILLRQISVSRRQVMERRADELSRWLENLHGQIESLQAPSSPRPDSAHRDRPHLSV
jgi:hypothetical protein